MISDTYPIVVATFERSGTHLTIDLIRKNFQDCRCKRFWGEYLENSFVNLDQLSPESGWPTTLKKIKKQLSKAKNPVIKTHTTPDLEKFENENLKFCHEIISMSKIIYVVRNPKNVMASYQLMKDGHPAKSAAEFELFLSSNLSCGKKPLEKWAHHVSSWRRHENVLLLNYDDVVKNVDSVVNRISTFINLEPIDLKNRLPKKIHSPWQRRWMRLTSLNPASTAVLARGRDKNYKPINWNEYATENCNLMLDAALAQASAEFPSK